MYSLIIEDDEGKATVAPLIRNQVTIGRAEDNTIRLTERNVSRKHARMWFQEGKVLIEDLQSYNGLWVNGDQVAGKEVVSPGDLIEIGDYHITLREEAPDGTGDARPSIPAASGNTPAIGVPSFIASPSGETQRGPAKLIVQNTQFAGQVFVLDGPVIQLGRTEDNDICIDDASVSRYHAKIQIEANSYKIVDLESANGVRVNGEDYAICDLRWGDIIELGTVQLRFAAPGEELPPPIPGQPVAGGDSKLPLLIGAGVVVALLVGVMAGAVWMTGRQKNKSRATTQPSRDRALAQRNLPDTRRPKPPSIAALMLQAQQAFDKEDYVGARAMLSKVLLRDPDAKKAQDLQDKTFFEQKQAKVLEASMQSSDEGRHYLAYKSSKKIDKISRYHERAEKLREALKPKVIQELLARARKAMGKQRLNEALQFNAEVLALDAKNNEAVSLRNQIQAALNPALNQRRAAPEPRLRRRMPVYPQRRRPMMRRVRRRKVRAAVPPRRRAKSRCELLTERSAARLPSSQLKSARYCHKLNIKRKTKVADAYFALGVISARLGHCRTPGDARYNLGLCEQSLFYYRSFLKVSPKSRRAAAIRKMLGIK